MRAMELAVNESNGSSAYMIIAITHHHEDTGPQRGWKVTTSCALSTARGWRDSKLKTTLCSAPWYQKHAVNFLFFSGEKSIKKNARKSPCRMTPSVHVVGDRPKRRKPHGLALVARNTRTRICTGNAEAEREHQVRGHQPGRELAVFLPSLSPSVSSAALAEHFRADSPVAGLSSMAQPRESAS